MKLDPGMHIGLHLVSFGKSGVTTHDLTSGAAGATLQRVFARVTRTASNRRTVRAACANCPCGEIGLLQSSTKVLGGLYP
jgi:hypothetical protein